MSVKLQKYESRSPERVQEKEWVAPRVDIYENDEEVLLLADLPGVDKESLKIHLDKDELSLEGTVKEYAGGEALTREFEQVDFRRAFLVPPGIDGEKITADLKNGVLWLHLPKSDALKPKQIEVKAG